MTIDNVTIVLVSSSITALVTFFVTSIANKKSIQNTVQEVMIACVQNHEKLYHRPEDSMKIHIENCRAGKRVDKMERALIYIVSQLGGDPKTLGLLDS